MIPLIIYQVGNQPDTWRTGNKAHDNPASGFDFSWMTLPLKVPHEEVLPPYAKENWTYYRFGYPARLQQHAFHKVFSERNYVFCTSRPRKTGLSASLQHLLVNRITISNYFGWAKGSKRPWKNAWWDETSGERRQSDERFWQRRRRQGLMNHGQRYTEDNGLYILAEQHSSKLSGDLLLTSSQETA